MHGRRRVDGLLLARACVSFDWGCARGALACPCLIIGGRPACARGPLAEGGHVGNSNVSVYKIKSITIVKMVCCHKLKSMFVYIYDFIV